MAYVKAPIPSEVYHLTKKANLESILDDGAIRRFDDTECWFCESLAKMKAYMSKRFFAKASRITALAVSSAVIRNSSRTSTSS